MGILKKFEQFSHQLFLETAILICVVQGPNKIIQINLLCAILEEKKHIALHLSMILKQQQTITINSEFVSTCHLLREKEITIFLKLVKTLGDQEREHWKNSL